MGIIRKRQVTSGEPCIAQGAESQQNNPAQPLDERASTSPAGPDVQSKPSRRSRRAPDVTRPLTIVRLQSRPKQLAPVREGGAPDWSLSAGVATVLFGFVIAFGTYVTLTQREEVKTRLRHFVDADKPHVEKRERSAPSGQPAMELAQNARAPVETPPAPLVAPNTAKPATAASETANTSTIVARDLPVARPAVLPARPSPAEQRTRSNASATPAVRDTPKPAVQGSNTASTQARAAPATPKEQRPASKAARNACGTLKSCDQPIAHDEHVPPHEPLTPRPTVKSTPTTPVMREAAIAAPASPMPPPVPTAAKTEATASVALATNRELFRRH